MDYGRECLSYGSKWSIRQEYFQSFMKRIVEDLMGNVPYRLSQLFRSHLSHVECTMR
jgi:hypothetical protein